MHIIGSRKLLLNSRTYSCLIGNNRNVNNETDFCGALNCTVKTPNELSIFKKLLCVLRKL